MSHRPERDLDEVEVADMSSTTADRPGVHLAGVGQRPSGGDAAGTVERPPVMDLSDVSVFYGSYEAVRDTSIPIRMHQITAMIGPSGCGKSTILRCLNRMNDLIPGARVTCKITYHGQLLSAPAIDPRPVSPGSGLVFRSTRPYP